MSVILRVDRLLEKMTGTVYGGQVKSCHPKTGVER